MPTAAPAKTQAPPDSGTVFLIAGTDEFEVSRRARDLVYRLCPESERALGLEVIEAACDTIEEATSAVSRCLDALRTVGFFGSSKLVWLRSASFFYDGKPGKYEEVKRAVAELTEEIKRGLLPGVRLVISAAQVDRRTSFFKTMEKAGAVEFFNLPEKSYKWDEHAGQVLRGMLEQAGLRAREDVVRLIVDRAGTDSRQLFQEVEKLSLYVHGRAEVTAADVLDIVAPARERGYSELTDAFGKRDLTGSLRVARQLLQQKESAVGLIIGLENRVRELLLYRTALDRRWVRITGSPDWPKVEWSASPEAEAFFSALPNDPRKANAFWSGILAKMAGRFSMEELQRIQRALVEEHGRMTDGSAQADVLLEWALIRCLGVVREKK
ncbi:MAG TPA: hypothetical protein PKE26_03210 [Kiritimatiellia bacterium]|nr:hypothetical protein [Kiritimatiellia bacterium]HMO98098.1 hypothetical protein [Kiritimatiellia bacterium]HMP96322.1 hypothetical protein [Kiritimatiellia bacterium]